MLSAAALQLVDPRHVTDVEFRDTDAGGREPRITIGYGPGSRSHCPEAGCGEASCPVHDTMERTWRHLNFFQYKAFIHASVPRVACPERGVGTATVPWARPGGGFTLLFEAMVVEPAKSQPVADIAEQVGGHDTRPWRFIRHHVDEARLYEDRTGMETIGIDETGRKGPPVHHRRRRPGGAQRDQRDAGQFRRRRQDILAHFDHRRPNAILEGLDSIIQHVKTRSRGFGNMDHFSAMIYLTCGKLGLDTVTA